MSEPITVIKNEYATLLYHPDTKIVHHTFHKPLGGDDFRAVLSAGIELLIEHKAIKWLSDDRGNSLISPEDTAWARDEWSPRAVATGWKYWALVVPDDILARMNLKTAVDSYLDMGLRVMVFSKPEKAMEWLINMGSATNE